jgi:hypothetical protein
LLACFCAQHAREMFGFVTAQDGKAIFKAIDEKSAPGHPCRS